MNGQMNGQYQGGGQGAPQGNFVPVNVAGGVQGQQGQQQQFAGGQQFAGQQQGQQFQGQGQGGFANQGWTNIPGGGNFGGVQATGPQQQQGYQQQQQFAGQQQGPPAGVPGQQQQQYTPPPGSQTIPGLPGVFVHEGHTVPVPQQQQGQQQQQASPFLPVWAEVSKRTGIPIDRVAVALDHPQKIAAVVAQFTEERYEAEQAANARQQQQFAPGAAQGQPGPLPGAQQVNEWQTYDIPPQVLTSVLVKDQQTGWFKPVDPMYAQVAAQANHNVVVEQRRAAIMRQNPGKIFEVDPEARKWFEGTVTSMVERRLQEERLGTTIENFKSQHRGELWQNDPMTGQLMADSATGKPLVSPLGHAFQLHLRKLSQSGMAPGNEMLDTALALARMQTGQMQQQQQQQGWGGQQGGWMNNLMQPPMPATPPAQYPPFGGQPMMPQNWGAPQAQPQWPGMMGPNNPYAGLQQLAQMNQGWNTWTPNAVARQTAAGELSFRDSLTAELSNAPENLSGWDYLQMIDAPQGGMMAGRMGGYQPAFQ